MMLVWAGLAFLLILGISASALRAVHLGDLQERLEPLRDSILRAFGMSEPNAARRAEAVARLDDKFAAHAMATLLHVASGALLFILLPLQFSTFVRSRYRAVHRWSGRLLVIVAWIAGGGGLFFGVLHPFAGPFERFFLGLIGTWFLFSITIAFVRIRGGHAAEHREWMLRAVAGALSISTVRLVAIPIDLVETSLGAGPEVVLLHSIWIGWGVTLLGAEWWIRRTRPSREALPPQRAPAAAEWLVASLTTFATSVASILPGHFPAYARVYHPFDTGGGSSIAAPTWRELTALAGRELRDPRAAEDFALSGVPNAQARCGTLPPALIEALLEHLSPATTTPDQCFFAVWEGFGDLLVPLALTPRLELPHRTYLMYAGPIAAALTSYSIIPFGHRSANLWWPADRAWCVATEIDFAWTYVGGPRACIDAILADPRLEAVETSAASRW